MSELYYVYIFIILFKTFNINSKFMDKKVEAYSAVWTVKDILRRLVILSALYI